MTLKYACTEPTMVKVRQTLQRYVFNEARLRQEKGFTTTKLRHSILSRVFKDSTLTTYVLRGKSILHWYKHVRKDFELSEHDTTNDDSILVVFGTSIMTVNYSCTRMAMVKFRHSSKLGVWNDERLPNRNFSKNDSIALVCGTSDTTLVYDAPVADDDKIPSIGNKSSRTWP